MGYFVTDVTDVTAKNNKLLCIRVCTRARKDVRSCKRMSVQAKVLQPAWCEYVSHKRRMTYVCKFCVAKWSVFKEKSAVFCDFFTLCPYFDPYIFRGWCVRKGAKRGRTEKGSSMRPIEYQAECLVFETSVGDYATFSSFFIWEKMKRKESKQSPARTPQTTTSGTLHHKSAGITVRKLPMAVATNQPPIIIPLYLGGATFDTKEMPIGERRSSAKVRTR